MKIILLLIVLCASCSLFNEYKRKELTYTADNQSGTVSLLVPKRFNTEEVTTDSAGNREQVYHYGNGMVLYFVHLRDTAKEYQPINKESHIPTSHPAGGLMYKRLDSTGLYWREVRVDRFRFGYKKVPVHLEAAFDSAVNYAGYRRVRK